MKHLALTYMFSGHLEKQSFSFLMPPSYLKKLDPPLIAKELALFTALTTK